jgi:hypothetical protein
MLETNLPLEKMTYNAKQLPKFTEPVHLSSGHRLYKAGLVGEITITKGNAIEARVGHYLVKINLDFLLHSSCSCHYKGICEHVVAGFMAVYEQIESPEQLFLIGSIPNGSKVSFSDPPRTPIPSPMIPSATAVKSIQPPLPKDSLEKWESYYDLILTKHQKMRYSSLFDLFSRITHELEGQVKNWGAGIQCLFMIQGILFYLQRIEENYRLDPGKLRLADYEGAFSSLYSALFSISHDFHADATMMPHLEAIKTLLAEKAFSLQHSPVGWQFVYCRLWWSILRDPVRVKRERRRVQVLIEESNLTDKEKIHFERMLAHLETMAENDERARERFHPSFDDYKDDILYILHTLAHEKKWERLAEWLAWYPLKRDHGYEMESYFEYCAFLTEQKGPVAEKGGELLKKHLPYSLEYYLDYLFEARQFRKWVDMILWSGFTPLDVSLHALKAIEAFDVRLLLPLYHQSIHRKIGERNRPAYQDAVELLIKLRTYYKKLKQIHRWEEYMERLLVQYRRLRAFSEELKKRNLLP